MDYNIFEIKKPEHTNKTFRMPNDLIARLEVLAQKNGISLNQLVIQCCLYALENLKESPGNEK